VATEVIIRQALDDGRIKQTFLAAARRRGDTCLTMGDYPGRKQVRKRAKRAAKNDRIIAKKAAAKK
jgi:hypothetical protein